MNRSFKYEQTTKILFGRGCADQIDEVVKNFGNRALLVTMPKSAGLEGYAAKVYDTLTKAGVTVFRYEGCVANPTVESVDMGVEVARASKVDVVIGLGGGSVMDTAKAIAVAAINPGSAWDYLFFKPQPQKTLPCIAITTTSGTGSHVTQVAVMTETATNTKSAIYNNLIYPAVAIVDPTLMLTMPRHITASTGFDAFTHCFESYININASPYTDIIALEGICMVAKHLRTACEDADNLDAREGMAWADTCGGLSIANAGVTLPHGVGMTIGGHCPRIMHGETLALTYPSFTRFTYQSAIDKFAVVGRILNPALESSSDAEAALGCCVEIDKLLKDIGMWLSFKDFDVEVDVLRAIADRSHDLPDYKANPTIASIEDIYQHLIAAYERV